MKKIEKVLSRIDDFFVSLDSVPAKKTAVFLFVFISFVFVIIARRPDAVTYPQFYAEDGAFWFQEAYNNGALYSFLIPKQGYFQTISRIGAAIAQLPPIEFAPLTLNIIAIGIQTLPALFFLSSRFNNIVPSFSVRLAISLIYLFLPHSRETHVNITNSQWRLAILMYLVMIAKDSAKFAWKAFDFLALAIGGLSGPFSVILAPIFFLYQRAKKIKKPLLFVTISLTAAIQLAAAYFSIAGSRSPAPLGAGITNFFKVISGHILIGGILGGKAINQIRGTSLWENGLLPIAAGLILTLILFYALKNSQDEIIFFIIFSAFIVAGALISPQVSMTKPQWAEMAKEPVNRYFLIPILATFFSLIWSAFNAKNNFIKNLSFLLLIMLIFIGILWDFSFKPLKDYKFKRQVEQFQLSKRGEEFQFKIPPEGWKMVLYKK